MSTDGDFTAYVGTHWSMLVRTALLLGCAPARADSVVAEALVGSYQRWARVWQDDRADPEVLTRLLDLIHEPTGRAWRGDKALPGASAGPEPDDDPAQQEDPALPRLLLRLDAWQRDALVLRYVAELDELEAAEVLDIRPDVAQQRIEEGLAAVRPALGEQQLLGLVEQHRADLLMSLPPPDLLASAHDVRRQRRRRAGAVTAGIVAAVLLVSGGVHVVRALVQDSPAEAAPATGPAPPWAQHPSGPSTRLVGLNGWAVRVPASWGTDEVGCDGVTAARPTVLFTRLLTPRTADCAPALPTVYVRIGDESFAAVPWSIISGVTVLRRPHVCNVCADLRLPDAGVSFEIRASSALQLRAIEASLQPIGPRQVTVPTGGPTGTDVPLDQLVTVATGEGLRPRVLEVPSRRPPGTFLRSDPPIGTPVDLGRSISLYFSAGDLGRYAVTRSLARHGWRIFPVAVARTTYPRQAALRAALGGHARPARHPTFLRTLTITHEGPRRVVVRRRLVWLVVTPTVSGSRDGATSISAVDATTGRVIEAQGDFRGRVATVLR